MLAAEGQLFASWPFCRHAKQVTSASRSAIRFSLLESDADNAEVARQLSFDYEGRYNKWDLRVSLEDDGLAFFAFLKALSFTASSEYDVLDFCFFLRGIEETSPSATSGDGIGAG